MSETDVTGEVVKVAAAADVPAGTARAVEADGVPIALVHAEGEYFAIYDECSHAAIPLSEGEIDGTTLECWLHGSRFDLRTGEPTGLPATEPVPVYPVEVRDGDVYVRVQPTNNAKEPGL